MFLFIGCSLPNSILLGRRSRYTQPLIQHFTRKEGNVLFNNALNTFFIYGYMASDIWLRTILIVKKETRCRNIGYSFRFAARVLLFAPSHRQDSTYHGLYYTSRGALAGTRNSILQSLEAIGDICDRTCCHKVLF